MNRPQKILQWVFIASLVAFYIEYDVIFIIHISTPTENTSSYCNKFKLLLQGLSLLSVDHKTGIITPLAIRQTNTY